MRAELLLLGIARSLNQNNDPTGNLINFPEVAEPSMERRPLMMNGAAVRRQEPKYAFTQRRIWRYLIWMRHQTIINELPSQPTLHQISLS
jgi:hypothetical protein